MADQWDTWTCIPGRVCGGGKFMREAEEKIEQLESNQAKLKVMIIVSHYWGKGATIDEAWQQVKKESFRTLRELKSGPHQIHVVWDTEAVKSRLDSMGFNITHPEGHPPALIHQKGMKT